MRFRLFTALSVVGFIALVFVSGCGSSSSLSDALTGLDQIPSASSMVTTNPNAIRMQGIFLPPYHGRQGLTLQVSGTPPYLVDIDSSNVGTYFFNGLIADIDANWAGWDSTQKNTKRDLFWKGQAGCWMAQGVGENLGRVLQSGTTGCYMKNIPSASSGVTITGAAAGDVFKQSAEDRTVTVEVSNMSHLSGPRAGTRTSMQVQFTILGTNTVGANVYKAQLWMCDGSTPTSSETIQVDKSTGVYTHTSVGDDGGSNVHSETLSAYLTVSGSSIVFDPSKSRNSEAKYSGGGFDYKGSMEITADNLINARRYDSGTWGTNKSYSVSAFSGTSMSTLRFLQAAINQLSHCAGCGGSDFSQATAVEYSDTYYAYLASSSLLTDVQAVDLTTETFFSSITSPTFDTTGHTCARTSADVTITMDFADSVVAGIQTTCEGDRYDNYDLCNSNTIQSVQNTIWN